MTSGITSRQTAEEGDAGSRRRAFVTGATGLLGNNLVRALLDAGFSIRALARSRDKAQRQFPGLDIEIVEGDMLDVPGFAASLAGVDVVFHTAAYFRDSYKGGRHWAKLHAANVEGTRSLLDAAYRAGVRRFVHASSIAVLKPEIGVAADETALRSDTESDDYYRSKILSDRALLDFLDAHPDMWAAMVLPGWMHGPGDMGPTSAGQLMLDYMQRKLPVIPPGTAPFVDARDVARAMILANEKGVRGERYLAAGRHVTCVELVRMMEEATGVPAPTRAIPLWVLFVVAAFSELKARITDRHVLVSWAGVKAVARENERSRFDHRKSERQLGLSFRPIGDTLRDEMRWYVDNGYLAKA